jgi:hypothetical protein
LVRRRLEQKDAKDTKFGAGIFGGTLQIEARWGVFRICENSAGGSRRLGLAVTRPERDRVIASAVCSCLRGFPIQIVVGQKPRLAKFAARRVVLAIRSV